MLSDETIEQVMCEAKHCAANLLNDAGCKDMNFEDFDFSTSVNERQIDEKMPDLEFVAIGHAVDPESRGSGYDFSGPVSSQDEIEEMENLLDKIGGEIILKNCQSDDSKHVFMIKGLNDKIYKIKKSTMLWNLSSGRLKRSNDRLRRFHRSRMDLNKTSRLNHNTPKSEISVGDWVIMQNEICHVSNFVYQTGRSKTCPLSTVPIDPPENMNRRGISVAGNMYTRVVQNGLFAFHCRAELYGSSEHKSQI